MSDKKPGTGPGSEQDPTEQPTESNATRPGAGPGAETPQPKKVLNTKLIAIVAVGALVLVGVTGMVVAFAQPSPVERAGDACSGSKPLDAFFAELAAEESQGPDDDHPEDEQEDEEEGDMAKLFDGVVRVEDDGTTLIVNTKPKNDDILGITSLALDCVYEQLDVPKHISERVGATRSLDGRQDGAWDGFTASWSYHPDSGANFIAVQD